MRDSPGIQAGGRPCASPPRPPLYCTLAGIAVFAACWFLAFLLASMLLVYASPDRSNLLAILALVVLLVGSSLSAALGLAVYHKLGRRHAERLNEGHRGEVFHTGQPPGP